MKNYAFGIDLGGTTAKIGLFTAEGALLEKWEVPTDSSNKGENIIDNLANSLKEKMTERDLDDDDILGIGIGVPGPVTEDRYVPVCANLGGWGGLDVASAFSEAMGSGISVKVGNDANVAALGEIWQGTAKGCRSMVMVTLGTGVGGGVICDGKVIGGAHGAGGEIGHICVNPDETEVCGCGKKGCLEQYSSATGIVRCMKKLLEETDEPSVLRGGEISAKSILDAARDGDALAVRELDDCAGALGYALASIATVADPEMFLLGGGVSRAGSLLTDSIGKYYKKYAFPACRLTPIRIASLGNDAGIYGAVRLVKGE